MAIPLIPAATAQYVQIVSPEGHVVIAWEIVLFAWISSCRALKSLDLPWVPQSQSQRDRLLEIEGARRPLPVASPLGQVGLLLVKLKGRYDEVLALSEKYRRHSDIAC
jgi:hypothetical protein